MSDIHCVYKVVESEDLPITFKMDSPNTVFKDVRRYIKKIFPTYKLSYSNFNGEKAKRFNGIVGKYKWDWVRFNVEGFSPEKSDCVLMKHLFNELGLKGSELHTEIEWEEIYNKEAKQNRVEIFVLLECLLESDQFTLSMLSQGLPPHVWPVEFKISEVVLTNIPSFVEIKYRTGVF